MCRAGKVRLINVMRRQQCATLPMQPPPTLLRAETAGAEGREKDIQGVPTRFSSKSLITEPQSNILIFTYSSVLCS